MNLALGLRVTRRLAVVVALALMSAHVQAQAAKSTLSQAPGAQRPPPAKAFQEPRKTWQRLGQAVRRGDKAAALAELTPGARERYEAAVDAMIAGRPSTLARFGTVAAVTLTSDRFATLSVRRKKADGLYGADVMLMRGEDGRWRIDKM